MKNINSLIVLITLVGVSVASAYYDQYGTSRPGPVTKIVETVAPSLTDDEKAAQERKEASRELEDQSRGAQRKYQDKQAKIQRKKEDRRSR